MKPEVSIVMTTYAKICRMSATSTGAVTSSSSSAAGCSSCTAAISDSASTPSTSDSASDTDLLPKAVEALLADGAFKLDTAQARSAYDTALKVKRYLDGDMTKSRSFEAEIVAMLGECIQHRSKKAKKNREKMWNAYHTLRVSDSYLALWKKLAKEVGVTGITTPAFYQFVGHQIFKKLIKLRYPLTTTSTTSDSTPPPLTSEEICGLRYLAGYIPKLIRKKLQKSTHPFKDDILLCIFDMLDDGDEEDDASQDWVKAVNRGGLTLINNVTFDVFLAIENEVRKVLRSTNVELTEEVMTSIASSDDVIFFWSLVCGDWEERSSGALLQMVVNQYVKIRGFSHASALVEKFKKGHKKTTQKSKGIRKQLISQPASDTNKD